MTSPTSLYSGYSAVASMSSPSKQITIIDVYDLAESINRDFEILAEKFGNVSFESIVKKVISALETLEALAKNNDKESCQILDLQRIIDRFEQEKQQRIRDKEHLERDIIELEENYKKEIDQLCKIVQKLKKENNSMKEEITSGRVDLDENTKNEFGDEHLQTLMDLRKMTHTQKEQIKELQKDLDSYCHEVESLRDNVERLIQQNKELLRKNSSLQKQGRMLLLERAEIMRRLQESEENALHLRHLLNETNRACKDMESQKEQGQQMDESPRFTLSELREVLQEKNALKAKVVELEERLDQMRTSSPGISDNFDLARESTPTQSENQSVASSSTAQIRPIPTIIDKEKCDKEDLKGGEKTEECLVFGPINREPDEKLHPWKYERKHSGIRRFFRIFNVISPSVLAASRPSSGSK